MLTGSYLGAILLGYRQHRETLGTAHDSPVDTLRGSAYKVDYLSVPRLSTLAITAATALILLIALGSTYPSRAVSPRLGSTY